MKIAIINPNTTASMTREIGDAAARSASADTQLPVRQSTRGPEAIEARLMAVRMAEMLARSGLAPSKRLGWAYPTRAEMLGRL